MPERMSLTERLIIGSIGVYLLLYLILLLLVVVGGALAIWKFLL